MGMKPIKEIRTMSLEKWISQISDEQMRESILKIYKENERWFMECPPSLSGKFHRNEATMESHSCRCCQVAAQLKRAFNLSKEDYDILISACILHDIGKSIINKKGKIDRPGWKYYGVTGWSAKKQDIEMHPILGSLIVARNKFPNSRKVQDLIECHMGHWSSSVCRQPSCRLEDLMVICDYIGSRDNIEIKE